MGTTPSTSEIEKVERKAVESGDVFSDLESCSVLPKSKKKINAPSLCIGDPNAIVENWTELSDKQTFLNQRTCEYNTVVYTEYKDFKEKDPTTIQQEYVADGLRIMLSSLGKDDSDAAIGSLLSESTVTTEYYLDTRPELVLGCS